MYPGVSALTYEQGLDTWEPCVQPCLLSLVLWEVASGCLSFTGFVGKVFGWL